MQSRHFVVNIQFYLASCTLYNLRFKWISNTKKLSIHKMVTSALRSPKRVYIMDGKQIKLKVMISNFDLCLLAFIFYYFSASDAPFCAE